MKLTALLCVRHNQNMMKLIENMTRDENHFCDSNQRVPKSCWKPNNKIVQTIQMQTIRLFLLNISSLLKKMNGNINCLVIKKYF